MKNKKQFRQGDVLIEQIDALPPGSQVQKVTRKILAHGEVTGHAHEVRKANKAEVFDIPLTTMRDDLSGAQTMTRLGLFIKKKTAVEHQEHAPIPLKKGVYRVTRQREYSPEEIRNVAD